MHSLHHCENFPRIVHQPCILHNEDHLLVDASINYPSLVAPWCPSDVGMHARLKVGNHFPPLDDMLEFPPKAQYHSFSPRVAKEVFYQSPTVGSKLFLPKTYYLDSVYFVVYMSCLLHPFDPLLIVGSVVIPIIESFYS